MLSDQELRARSAILELDRTLGVFDGMDIVGTAGILSFQMTIPGGQALPCAGVTRVTVSATHRRQGLLSAMMRRQLQDVHERGEPIAALYASEAAIYGRFGYGIATYQATIEIERRRAAFAPSTRAAGRLVTVDASEAIAPFTAVWEQARRRQPGMLTMDERWWRFVLSDPPGEREGASPQYLVIYQDEKGPAGFVRYRMKISWNEADEPDGSARVSFLIAASPEAYAGLWRYILDIDLISKVSADMRPPEEPLRFLLTDSRQPKTRIQDGLWLRLVDAPRCLEGRRYATEGRLVLRLQDELCDWNRGTFELVATPAGAQCRPTDASPDIEMNTRDLAAIYLGGTRPSLLHQAGRLDEHRAGSIARADALFATEIVPWCPTHF